MEFKINRIENLYVSDDEIFELLSQVYVEGGFASADVAKTVFDPERVRARGSLIVAKETSEDAFSGMVIIVPHESHAAVRAKDNECEMHLLGVSPKYRGHGLGRMLVNNAVDFAIANEWSKMILWTQKPMKEAQAIYETSGFTRTGEMTRNGIDFFVYERELA